MKHLVAIVVVVVAVPLMAMGGIRLHDAVSAASITPTHAKPFAPVLHPINSDAAVTAALSWLADQPPHQSYRVIEAKFVKQLTALKDASGNLIFSSTDPMDAWVVEVKGADGASASIVLDGGTGAIRSASIDSPAPSR